jgi:hypothetical protein
MRIYTKAILPVLLLFVSTSYGSHSYKIESTEKPDFMNGYGIQSKSYFKGEEILVSFTLPGDPTGFYKFYKPGLKLPSSGGTVFYVNSESGLKAYFKPERVTEPVKEASSYYEALALTTHYTTYLYAFAEYDQKKLKRIQKMKIFWAGQGKWGRGDWNHLRPGHSELRDRKIVVIDTNDGKMKSVRPEDFEISIRDLNKVYLSQLKGKNIYDPMYFLELAEVMLEFQLAYLDNPMLRNEGLLPLGIVDDAALITKNLFIGFLAVGIVVLGITMCKTLFSKVLQRSITCTSSNKEQEVVVIDGQKCTPPEEASSANMKM